MRRKERIYSKRAFEKAKRLRLQRVVNTAIRALEGPKRVPQPGDQYKGEVMQVMPGNVAGRATIRCHV